MTMFMIIMIIIPTIINIRYYKYIKPSAPLPCRARARFRPVSNPRSRFMIESPGWICAWSCFMLFIESWLEFTTKFAKAALHCLVESFWAIPKVLGTKTTLSKKNMNEAPTWMCILLWNPNWSPCFCFLISKVWKKANYSWKRTTKAKLPKVMKHTRSHTTICSTITI